MLEGLYSAAAGMAAQQQRMDAVSNDLANVSTTGYKGERVAFRDLVYVGESTGQGVRAGAGAAVVDAGRTSAQGALQSTDQPLDVAIVGSGFLTVRRPDGTQALTRDGALRLNTARELVTVNGDRVAPAIRIPAGVAESAVKIGTDGRVTAAGRAVGRLAVVDVPAPAGLAPLGGSLFAATAASGAPRAARGTTVQQGALEASNVDQGDAMVDLLDAQRSFSLASRAIQTQDQALEIANGVKR